MDTPSGAWEFGWDPQLATLYGRHAVDPGGDEERISRWYGTTRGGVPTLGALEERLGFAVPWQVQRQLVRDVAQGLAAASDDPAMPQSLEDLTPPEADEQPTPTSTLVMPTGETTEYGAAVADEPHLRRWLHGDHCLDVLDARYGKEPGADGSAEYERWVLRYRYRYAGVVIVSGDDITIDYERALTDDDVLRDVADAIGFDPGSSPRQRDWLRSPASAELAAAMKPPASIEPGCHVRFTIGEDDTGTLGRVVAVVEGPDDTAGGYRIRPDLADLPGHPWQHSTTTVFVGADRVAEAVLQPADAGLDPTRPLGYRTLVSYRRAFEATDGHAEVLRAWGPWHPDRPAARYDLRPLDSPDAGRIVTSVPTALVRPLRGSWWVTADDMVTARLADGVGFGDGEVLNGVDDPVPLEVHAVKADGTPKLTPIYMQETNDMRARVDDLFGVPTAEQWPAPTRERGVTDVGSTLTAHRDFVAVSEMPEPSDGLWQIDVRGPQPVLYKPGGPAFTSSIDEFEAAAAQSPAGGDLFDRIAATRILRPPEADLTL